jgi:hypothetical protein
MVVKTRKFGLEFNCNSMTFEKRKIIIMQRLSKALYFKSNNFKYAETDFFGQNIQMQVMKSQKTLTSYHQSLLLNLQTQVIQIL